MSKKYTIELDGWFPDYLEAFIKERGHTSNEERICASIVKTFLLDHMDEFTKFLPIMTDSRKCET